MQTTADRDDFSPPDDHRWRRPLALALVAHGVLVAALTWGLRWNTEPTEAMVVTELWSSLPQVAAPRLQAPEPEEAPPPPPAPQPRPPTPAPSPAPTPAVDAQIALQKKADARRREEEQAQRRLAEQKQQRERQAAEQREQARQRREAEQVAQQKKAADAARAKAEREKAEREQAAKDKAEQKKKQDTARKAEDARRDAQLEAERQKNLARMMGQAGATGAANARGTASQTSGPGGPSANYAGKVVAKIKPNIVFTDAAPGNPRAEVEVRTLPDGSIANARLLKSSGVKAWDDAVLRAVERTASLPRDEDGRVPATLILGFRPND